MSAAGDNRWPVWKLALLLYPFTTATVAINLFLVGLMAQAVGLANITPLAALWISLPLGVPVTWLAGCWVRALMDEADDG